MPSKRQKPLPFQRTVVQRSARSTATASDPPVALHTPTPSNISSAPSAVSTPALRSPAPPLPVRPIALRHSWVFRHMPDEDMQTKYYNEATKSEEWRCRYCVKVYACSGGTTAPARHLEDFHEIPKDSARDVTVKNIQRSIGDAFAQAAANPQKRRRLDTDEVSQDRLESLWIRCLVSCNLAFNIVTNPEFRAFIMYLNSQAEEFLTKGASGVKRWVMRQYHSLKSSTVIPVLRKARTKIHISCDLWTSPNSKAILGITAQFINEGGILQSLVLGMKEVVGEHTGENIAQYVIEVLKDYGIVHNLGYFTMDNAPDNDTMMTALSLILRREFRLQYDPIHHRIRCQGHVINLAVKSFLFVTDKEALEEDEETNIYNISVKEIEEWRKKGPLGKLHNFVIFLHKSTQRLHHFLELSGNHRIPRDNTTRWNSWYMMLQMCWALRDVIDEFIALHGTIDLLKDKLTDMEWATVRVIKDFLEKLAMSTKACESSESTLDLVLPCTDYILQIFEKHKNDYKDDPTFASMFNSGWKKMNKYYELSDKSPAYVAAIILHPSRKWRWIEKHWKPEWIPSAKQKMKTFWETKYKPDEASMTSLATATALPMKPPNEFLQWLDEEDDITIGDEYTRYCALPQVPGVKQGYKWWLEPTQQKNFPYLSKMALDILSIPAMSADPERLFSGAKITISDRRNRLGIFTIEALECLKSWLKIQMLVDDDEEDEGIQEEEIEDIRQEGPILID
jgi:hAT family C-terminal dimerisation region/BED zinc finger